MVPLYTIFWFAIQFPSFLVYFQIDAWAYGDVAKWYTYNRQDLLCIMFSECEDFSDAFCADCVSGQPACVIEEGLPGPGASTTPGLPPTSPPTTTPQFPPDCEYTGQTLPNPLSCRKYYECLADGSWGEFNCCPNVFNPELETCVTEEEGGELCGEDDEGCQ